MQIHNQKVEPEFSFILQACSLHYDLSDLNFTWLHVELYFPPCLLSIPPLACSPPCSITCWVAVADYAGGGGGGGVAVAGGGGGGGGVHAGGGGGGGGGGSISGGLD